MTGQLSLESVLVPDFARRPARAPEHREESTVLLQLVDELARAPGDIFRCLVDAVLKLCRAHSAGVSLLDAARGEFVWPAVAGVWSTHVGGRLPRHASPCGAVLDRDAALVFRRPEQHFPALAGVQPAVEEGLLLPVHFEGAAVGTVWAVLHDRERQFDPEDERLLGSLARLCASAYRTLADTGALSRWYVVG